jgi:hypothetical protein
MENAIILCRQEYGWSATFLGVDKMPEDVELPLPLTLEASLLDVIAHMSKRFPKVWYWYRENPNGAVMRVDL